MSDRLRIYVVEDDESSRAYWREVLVEAFPDAIIKTFESPLDAWKHGAPPTHLVYDVGCIGFGFGHSSYHSPIMNLLSKWPGIVVILTSFIDYMAADVMANVKEDLPESIVLVGTPSAHVYENVPRLIREN